MRVRFTSCLILLTAVAACKTTSKQDPASEAKATSGAPTAPVISAASTQGTLLPRPEGQALYVKMLEIEMAKGTKVAQDKVHQVSAIFDCELSGLKTCSFRVRLSETELSPSQPAPRPISDILSQKIPTDRPELKSQKTAKIDVRCNYVGKASPPYTLEDVQCQAIDPRSDLEATFEGRIAEELSESLRTTQTFGEARTDLSGAIQCQWMGLSSRAACTVRVLTGGMAAEDMRELPPQAAEPTAKKLRETALEAKLTSDPTSIRNIAGMINCAVDGSPVKDGKLPLFNCRVEIR